MSDTTTSADAASARVLSEAGELLRRYGALLGMVAILVVIQVLKPGFLGQANIENVLRQSTILIILSLGLTVVLIMRGVDLSVAQIADASAVFAAGLLISGQPTAVALLLPVGFGLFVGLANGVMSGYLGVPAIIGTLGSMFVVRSAELIYTNGSEPQILFTLPAKVKASFLFLGQKAVLGVPALILLAVAVVLVVGILMTLTPFGRQAKAVGSNVRAAYLAGIDIRAVFAGGFVISGVLAAIAGVALASRTGIAMPRGAEPFLLEAFAAAYLGTLASRTGSMSIVGTLIGALFIAFLGNGLTMLGFGAPTRAILNGAFILLAMAVGALKRQQ